MLHNRVPIVASIHKPRDQVTAYAQHPAGLEHCHVTQNMVRTLAAIPKPRDLVTDFAQHPVGLGHSCNTEHGPHCNIHT
jgi:hypothetical protein